GSGWLYLAGFVAVIVAAVMAFVLFTRQRSHVEAATAKLTVEQQSGPTVEVVTAHRVTGSDQLRLIGEAHPFQTAIVYAKVAGDRQAVSSCGRRCTQQRTDRGPGRDAGEGESHLAAGCGPG